MALFQTLFLFCHNWRLLVFYLYCFFYHYQYR